MSRRGRKRKQNVDRQPNGRANVWENPKAATELRRMASKLRHDVTHPWYGYPLGKLALSGYITAEEFEAGTRWAELTWRWGQIMGIAMPMCRAINWEGSHGKSLADPPQPEEIERVKTRKVMADMAISRAGFGVERECIKVIIEDCEPDRRELVRAGLRALV